MLPSFEQPNQCPAPSGDAASLVLEAERVALAEVEHYKHQMQELVAESSLRAEQLHKRTEARIKRLHERMTAAAQLRQAQINSEMVALEGEMVTDGSTSAPLDSAIVRIAEELAGISESS
ncbi:MAG: hypothetical protein PHQ05_07095 [Sterolibacterium sp.]|nr:hypothetical protein [Sterolibacterium sp.]